MTAAALFGFSVSTQFWMLCLWAVPYGLGCLLYTSCLRSFRQLLGITPIQYVKQYRIEKAAELLLSTSMKIGEIGDECGFSDTSYFTKTFREIKHCTPREYRQKFAGREQSLSRRDGGRAGAPAETAL